MGTTAEPLQQPAIGMGARRTLSLRPLYLQVLDLHQRMDLKQAAPRL